jgi:hypothetical protein
VKTFPALVCLFAATLCLQAAEPPPTPAEPDSITLEKTSPAVQKTILANIGAGKVISISKNDDDVPGYQVDFTMGDENRDLKVALDGTLLNIAVALGETPAAVQKSIQAQLAGGDLGSIEKTFDGDDILYVVEKTAKDGRASQFILAENGDLQEIEIALTDAPVIVQQTLAAQMETGTLTTLTKMIDESVIYEAKFTKSGKKSGAKIASNGDLLSLEITLEETGAAAQKTIQEEIGNGKILTVSKSFERRGNIFPFKVESIKNGKSFNFSVGPEGLFLGVDE